MQLQVCFHMVILLIYILKRSLHFKTSTHFLRIYGRDASIQPVNSLAGDGQPIILWRVKNQLTSAVGIIAVTVQCFGLRMTILQEQCQRLMLSTRKRVSLHNRLWLFLSGCNTRSVIVYIPVCVLYIMPMFQIQQHVTFSSPPEL